LVVETTNFLGYRTGIAENGDGTPNYAMFDSLSGARAKEKAAAAVATGKQ
jgi:hypothetical protein